MIIESIPIPNTEPCLCIYEQQLCYRHENEVSHEHNENCSCGKTRHSVCMHPERVRHSNGMWFRADQITCSACPLRVPREENIEE